MIILIVPQLVPIGPVTSSYSVLPFAHEQSRKREGLSSSNWSIAKIDIAARYILFYFVLSTGYITSTGLPT